MKKIIYIILILVLFGVIFYVVRDGREETVSNPKNNIETKYVSYENYGDGLEFVYPESWGEIIPKEGNKICPEEDAYSTNDTLRIFDKELAFDEIKLPESQSFIRIGVRTYLLDPNNPNSCGDDFHLKIANKEIIPETLSSFRLNSITLKSGLSGVKNEEAVTINTTARTLYTFFVSENSKIYIIQTYMSFIPYYGSPELREMDEDFDGDINEYIKKGKTALNIRKYLEEFTKMTESLRFSKED